MRTILTIPEEMAHRLDRLAHRRRLSRAEVIRRAVEAFLRKESEASVAEAFGLWRGRRANALTEQRRLRAEWDG